MRTIENTKQKKERKQAGLSTAPEPTQSYSVRSEISKVRRKIDEITEHKSDIGMIRDESQRTQRSTHALVEARTHLQLTQTVPLQAWILL